jgi:hypothetical protein
LSDIAKKVNKSTGHLSNLMKPLLKLDIIIKNDKRYYFRDQVLRFWLAKTSLGKSHDMISDTEIAENFISNLKERYLKKSSEYGYGMGLFFEAGSKSNQDVKGDVYDFMLFSNPYIEIFLQEIKTFREKHKIIDVPFIPQW